MSMTSKERVRAVLNHEVPDRVPIVLGVSNATGIKMNTYQAIKNIVGIEEPNEYIYDWPELGTAKVGEETLQRLHVDVRGILDLEPETIRLKNRNRPAGSPYVDSWRTGQVRSEGGEWIIGPPPLSEVDQVEALADYAWPDPDDPTRYAHIRSEVEKLAEANEYAIMGIPWLLFPFERAMVMQGMDRFLINMAMKPEFTRAFLEKLTDLCKRIMGHFLEECGEYLDMVKIGDDLGTQESLLISPKMYREFLKPCHADLIAYIKERTDAKVFFHTDGDVFNLIEDFIDIGVDVLNPIQTSAGRMSDLEALKDRFGGRIVFCGAIDTHRVLPMGTPEEVDNEVRRVIEILGRDGGYMLSGVHTVMNDVPAQNVLAMVDAVEKYGYYPLR
jgi:uroporphyrinogen decarboxylase